MRRGVMREGGCARGDAQRMMQQRRQLSDMQGKIRAAPFSFGCLSFFSFLAQALA